MTELQHVGLLGKLPVKLLRCAVAGLCHPVNAVAVAAVRPSHESPEATGGQCPVCARLALRAVLPDSSSQSWSCFRYWDGGRCTQSQHQHLRISTERAPTMNGLTGVKQVLLCVLGSSIWQVNLVDLQVTLPKRVPLGVIRMGKRANGHRNALGKNTVG